MTLGIAWAFTGLTSEQVDFLNLGARGLGYTGEPVTLESTEAHPIFTFLNQSFINIVCEAGCRQVDIDAMTASATDKTGLTSTAATIT